MLTAPDWNPVMATASTSHIGHYHHAAGPSDFTVAREGQAMMDALAGGVESERGGLAEVEEARRR